MFLCIVLIINTLDCSTNNFTVYCVLLFFSLFPYRDNEAEVSHIHRKQITSALKIRWIQRECFHVQAWTLSSWLL